jgi:putative transcriptional regulator
MGSAALTRVARARAEAGLTQAELADRVSASRKTISRIEAGNYCPRLPLAARIARELEIPIEQILEGAA